MTQNKIPLFVLYTEHEQILIRIPLSLPRGWVDFGAVTEEIVQDGPNA